MGKGKKNQTKGGPQARCPECGRTYRTIKGLLEHCREKGHRRG